VNNNKNVDTENTNDGLGTDKKYMKLKKFHFIMILFFSVFLTAGITAIVLSFGDDKVVDPKNKINVPNINNGILADGIIGDYTEFEKLFETYKNIKENYVDEIDAEQLVEGAINGMVDAMGDPYSDYMTAEETESFNEQITSSFEGIGATIEERDGNIVIVAPIKGSPAEKAGLRANDAIIEVDGKNIQGMSSSEAVLLIRGEKGTEVSLTISRPGVKEPIHVEITRDVIPIETVYYEMLDHSIGKIQITSFSEHTYDELTSALDDLKTQGMKGLILDVRQNPGGLLNQAIDITSLFVPKGKVIYQMEYKDGTKERQLSNQKETFDIPLVAVVDEGSASASEILAGALKESANVPIVGVKTYGKGTAQTAASYSDGSSLKLTTARWLTPDGNWIHEKGITPDYIVELPEYAKLPYVSPELELKESMMSDEISIIEEMLDVLGYEPGKVDGMFDADTKQAVTNFQRNHDLEVTGIVSGETTTKIMEALGKKLEEEDPQIQKAVELLLKKIK
jgi:carboxyl-terminal processing protease